MRVPTEAEWGNYQADLDQEYAHKMFAGRSNQEMIPHFRRNVIERTDELRWMPPSLRKGWATHEPAGGAWVR